MKKSEVPAYLFIIIIVSAVALHFILAFIFSYFGFLPYLYPNQKSDHSPLEIAIILTLVNSCGITLITTIALYWEHIRLKKNNTSLQRLRDPSTMSRKTDLFYFLLTISGLKNLLALLLGFSIGQRVYLTIQEMLSFSFLSHFDPVTGFFILALCNTFVFYIVHRIMHTRFFWKVHQVHHSAEELNIITPHRNHPIDLVVVLIFGSFVSAILGASWWQNIIYIVLNGWYQQFVHTTLKWENPILKRIFITSQDHWLHHAKNSQYWNKNYGVLIIWDKLFGTYLPYDKIGDQKIEFGLTDYQPTSAFKEMFSLYFLSLKSIFLRKK